VIQAGLLALLCGYPTGVTGRPDWDDLTRPFTIVNHKQAEIHQALASIKAEDLSDVFCPCLCQLRRIGSLRFLCRTRRSCRRVCRRFGLLFSMSRIPGYLQRLLCGYRMAHPRLEVANLTNSTIPSLSNSNQQINPIINDQRPIGQYVFRVAWPSRLRTTRSTERINRFPVSDDAT